MKILLCAALLAFTGCTGARQFGAGFRDRGLEMAGEIAADELASVVDAKLGDNFKEMKDILGTIPGQIPKPSSPVDQGILYTLGSLAAYIAGSFGKGAVRKYAGKKTA
jgi:hypothetical protein